MKKSSLLACASLFMAGVLITSCAEPLSKENGLKDVYTAIDAIQNVDYKTDIKTAVYYTESTYYEHFTIDLEAAGFSPDTFHADFRIVEDKTLTRIDFSNPSDLYYYNMTIRTFKYLTSYDDKTGTTGYSDTIVRFGKQFYKKNDKYVLQNIGSRGIEATKSLKLDQYPYVDAAKLSSIESSLASGINKFSLENGKILFDEYFTKIFENTYRINDSFVNKFQNDGTDAYEYFATESTFAFNCNKELEFDYYAPVFEEVDVTVKSITEVEGDYEEAAFIPFKVAFSNGKSVEILVPADSKPSAEDLADPSKLVTIDEETKTIVVCGVNTEMNSTENILQGSKGKILKNSTAGLDKNSEIVETFVEANGFWAKTELAKSTGNREVNFTFNKSGFLTSSYIDDERIYKTFKFDCDEFYTKYYTTADFNVDVPHVYKEK